MATTTVPFSLDAAPDLVDLSIQEVWLKSPADKKEYYKEYYYVEPVKDYTVKDSSITSVEAMSYVPENGSVQYSSPYQGFDKSYSQNFFLGGLRITRPLWRYGIQTRRLEAMVRELKNDAIRFMDAVLAGPFNNMTSTSYTETKGKTAFTVTNTGGDSVCPNSTSHTREDSGSNWNNQITDGTTVNMDFVFVLSPLKIFSE